MDLRYGVKMIGIDFVQTMSIVYCLLHVRDENWDNFYLEELSFI